MNLFNGNFYLLTFLILVQLTWLLLLSVCVCVCAVCTLNAIFYAHYTLYNGEWFSRAASLGAVNR